MRQPPSRIYTLSLHDALPISQDDLGDRREDERVDEAGAGDELPGEQERADRQHARQRGAAAPELSGRTHARSEEHTSELQSLRHLVCRLLLEKKKKNIKTTNQ